MKYKIVLVPFPFDDLSAVKVRPAICLTGKIGKYDHIIIAFISSQIPDDKTDKDVILEKGTKTGLKVKSLLRLHRLTTIPINLILKQLGQIPVNKKTEIQNKLSLLFDLETK